MLKRNYINVHLNTGQLALRIWRLSKVSIGWPYRWFWKYFKRFPAKGPRVLRSSWILNESSLYCKIVKNCILSEVCMKHAAPHSTNEAESRIGYWLRGYEGERNNCFSKIRLVGQKYRDQTTLANKTRFSRHCFVFQSRHFSPLVGYNI